MAIEKFVNQTPEVIEIDGPIVRFMAGAALEAPRAAGFLAEVASDRRAETVEELLEFGAMVAATAKTSAHVVMMEGKVEELASKLNAELGDQLKDARHRNVQSIERVLSTFQKDLVKILSAREAVLQKSVLRGARFEDILSARLPLLARGIGRVEHCARSAGESARNAGDYVLTIESAAAGSEVKIVVEAKAQKTRFSSVRIREELRTARLNRGAQAAVFVAETTDSLPDGLGFGQVSDSDFFVVFDPQNGDETLLSCGLVMAKAAALAAVKVAHGDGIDMTPIANEVSTMRKLLEGFAKVEQSCSKIEKEAGSARSATADIKSDVLQALRRLEAHLN